MNRRTIPVFLLIVALALFFAAGAAAQGDTQRQDAASLPYEYLSEDAIRLATVQILPRNVLYNLSADEVKALVAILRTAEAVNRDDSHSEYSGEAVIFTVMMVNGTVETITAFNPFIIMGGVGYRTETCYALSKLGRSIVSNPSTTPGESAILQLLDKINGSILIRSGSTNNVKVGQVMHIVTDENQSVPARWKAVISQGGLVGQIHDVVDTSNVAENRMPGAGGERHFFYFEALSPGECTINMNCVYIGGDEEVLETEVYTIHIAQ